VAEGGVIFERLGFYDSCPASEERQPGLNTPSWHEQRYRLIILAWRHTSTRELCSQLNPPREDTFVVAIDRHDQSQVPLMTVFTQQLDA
jgi:hypothetical protein